MTSPVDAIRGAVQSVTNDWARQRKAEERSRNAVLSRRMRLMPSYRVTLREAAFDVMEDAYRAASDGGTLPVKPRQIMYAARPEILKQTGERSLNGTYFSQTLLIDYMEEHDCSDWDIIWDARGHFAEPHTRREVALGTLEVRQYLGERPSFDPPLCDLAYPTAGPENRYGNVLFIEKEGFHPILQAARLQERFDTAIMSTKGMSVTASRMLLDRLADNLDHVFALHDLDISGFSIFGTLGTDSRRYTFHNDVQIIDFGLRLADVLEMGLQSEPVSPVNPKEWPARAATLRRHGAMPEEIEFLRRERVELNAMTSRQLIVFIERKLKEYGVEKVIPDDDVIEMHARRVIKQRLVEQTIAKTSDELAKQTKALELPQDLREQIEELLEETPELPWDEAVAQIVANVLSADSNGAR
jgi:DNA topoisomerase 6 subunit A-like protein